MEGNQMKMREAMIAIQKLVQANIAADEFDDLEPLKEYVQIRDICNAALSAPPRQCDVGTAKEQANRMRKFCSKQKRDGIINCGYCPIKHEYQRDCTLEWEQMPYKAEEGDAK